METYPNCTNSSSSGEYWTRLEGSFPWHNYILYLLVVIGIVSNALVIYIQSRLGGARVSSARSTNSLIICLAVADLMTAVFIIPIPEIVNIPKNSMGEFFCRFIGVKTLAWICFMGSVYTLTTISIERYLAVVHPFTYRVLSHSNYFIGVTMLVVWFSAISINVFLLAFHTVDECGQCSVIFPSERARKVNGIFIFLVEYCGPLCIMCFASVRSIHVLRVDNITEVHNDTSGRTSDPQSSVEQTTKLRKLRRRFTTMFTVIIVTFMVLWAPDQISYLLYNLGAIPDWYIHSATYDFLVKIAFLNATLINPLVYSIWLPRFRLAFRDLVLCRNLESSRGSETTRVLDSSRGLESSRGRETAATLSSQHI